MLSLTALACAALCAGLPGATVAAEPAATANTAAVLHLGGRTELPSYSGDFDHFAADVKGNRLFLAGEDQGTLEVFDLQTGAHLRTVKGFEQPHGILYLPDVNRLIVTDSGAGMTKVVDATSYRVIGSIPLTVGADSMQYDPSRQHLYVVTGGKNAEPKMSRTIVAEVDPRTGRHIGDMTFDTDFTESIAAEQKRAVLDAIVAREGISRPVRKCKAARLRFRPASPAPGMVPRTERRCSIPVNTQSEWVCC